MESQKRVLEEDQKLPMIHGPVFPRSKTMHNTLLELFRFQPSLYAGMTLVNIQHYILQFSFKTEKKSNKVVT